MLRVAPFSSNSSLTRVHLLLTLPSLPAFFCDAMQKPSNGAVETSFSGQVGEVHHLALVVSSLTSEALPGIAAGATSIALGHPFDTVKTRMQSMVSGATTTARRSSSVLLPSASIPTTVSASSSSSSQTLLRHFHTALRDIFADSGLRGLYRGALPPLCITAAKRGVQFSLWERLLDVTDGSSFIAGAITGGLGTIVGCPVHVVKIHMQLTPAKTVSSAWIAVRDLAMRDAAAAAGGSASGTMTTAHPAAFPGRKAISSSSTPTRGSVFWRGVRVLYRGFSWHVTKDTVFAGTYLGLYGRLRGGGGGVMGSEQETTLITIFQRSLQHFGAGALASVATWAMMFPLDTLKTVSQSGSSATDVLRRIFLTSRSDPSHIAVTSLWRGCFLSLLKAGPVSGASMLVYEAVRTRRPFMRQ